jgi:NAD(P)H-dependent flavin oxidoreductase YrpB (nitropropane dioxygenase family)
VSSSLRTPLCDLLGIDIPIGNAGMAGGTALAPLATAVSKAGGLGAIGGIDARGPEFLRQQIQAVRAATDRPFSVNLLAFVLDAAPVFLDVCIEERVPSVTLSFGDVAKHVARVNDAGITVIRQMQTIACAREAVAQGVDVIIAQGGEAGGHTGSVATMALVPQVVDLAGSIPVIAAGGIADGRGLVAALALGAQGVIMGTRFVASEECTTSAHEHREKIIAATADDTIFTDVFDIVDGMKWPAGISGRSIKTAFAAEWHGRESDLAALRAEILAESTTPNQAPQRAHSAYAGQSAGLIRDVKPAAAILRDIVAEAEAVLARLAP